VRTAARMLLLSAPMEPQRAQAWRTRVVGTLWSIAVLLAASAASADDKPAEVVKIDASESAPGTPFRKHWGDFGAEQAPTTLDPEYGRQLSKIKRGIPSFQYVRFHNIFSEELVRVDRKPDGKLDFDDLDKVFGKAGDVYKNLLDRKLKPYVELGFMPRTMAKHTEALHAFTYKPIVSEPKDFDEWSLLVSKFTQYLVKRFGADEVRSWPFEIWNEYNLDFYAGPHDKAAVYEGAQFKAKELSYYKLYAASASALRRVDSKIKIVGPGTAAVYGLGKFINWCVDNKVSLPDRISTHVYGNEDMDRVLEGNQATKDGGAAWVKGAEGAAPHAPAKEAPQQYQLGSLAMKKARADVLASKAPWLAEYIEFTEFNRSYNKDPQAQNPDSTDRASHGPWLVDSYKRSVGVVSRIVHWVGTDYRFEELPWERQADLPDRHGGFGVMDRNGTWKAGGNVMRALEHLPEGVQLAGSEHTMVTRGPNGQVGFVAYNPSSTDDLKVHAELQNIPAGSVLRTWRIDDKNANAQRLWKEMGSPKNATPEQIKELNKAAQLRSRTRPVTDKVTVRVPSNGVVVGVIEPARPAPPPARPR
jgi:xylan 1,4-beta-xylosidase